MTDKLDAENEFAKGASEMKIPSMFDNIDWGKPTKLVKRKVVMRDSKTGKVYGSRAIMTKEDESPSFKDFLLSERVNDLTTLPDSVISEIRKNVSSGAKDLAQDWTNALELVHTAYHVANVRRPRPDQKGAWKQYEEMIAFAVKQLTATRGIDGKWRASSVMYTEGVGDGLPKRRFFVEFPGAAAVEAEADTMDDVIDQLANKMRRHGVKLRVEHRSQEGAVLSVWVQNVKREEITVKQVS